MRRRSLRGCAAVLVGGAALSTRDPGTGAGRGGAGGHDLRHERDRGRVRVRRRAARRRHGRSRGGRPDPARWPHAGLGYLHPNVSGDPARRRIQRRSADGDGPSRVGGRREWTGAGRLAPAPAAPATSPGWGTPRRPRSRAARFRTGDLGRWRDGRLEVLGRADDVIVTGGEKVAPAGRRARPHRQPGVRAACVAALPDAEWGQVVVAAVVWESPAAYAALSGRGARRARPRRGAAPGRRRGRDPPAWDRQARSGGRRTPRERRRRRQSPGPVSPPATIGRDHCPRIDPSGPIRCAAPHSSQTSHQEAQPCGRCCPCWPPPS